jgi:hypothetical protein
MNDAGFCYGVANPWAMRAETAAVVEYRNKYLEWKLENRKGKEDDPGGVDSVWTGAIKADSKLQGLEPFELAPPATRSVVDSQEGVSGPVFENSRNSRENALETARSENGSAQSLRQPPRP